MKNEETPENKEIFVYEFKHVKRDKVDEFILVGRKSDELFENDDLFNFWSNEFLNKDEKNRDFKITRWPFITLYKRNNFLEIQGICL